MLLAAKSSVADVAKYVIEERAGVHHTNTTGGCILVGAVKAGGTKQHFYSWLLCNYPDLEASEGNSRKQS